jgi:hypothetical protein
MVQLTVESMMLVEFAYTGELSWFDENSRPSFVTKDKNCEG